MVTGTSKHFYRLDNGQIVMLNDWVRTKSVALLWYFFSAVVNWCVTTAGFHGKCWGQELLRKPLLSLDPLGGLRCGEGPLKENEE